MRNNKLLLALAVSVCIIALDQWVKFYIKTHFYLGEEINVMGNWFKIHFTENYGMAFGLEFGGKSGKLLLTLFRIIAIGFIAWYLVHICKRNHTTGYIISWAMIMAGAIGNLIDSIFYGVWFGYETLFHGRVVDMLYFPIIRTTIPESFPFWAGEDFEFFSPVFNMADASISIGFFIILIFQKHLLASETLDIEKNEQLNTDEDGSIQR